MKLGGFVAPDCSKEIHQYSLNGDYIRTWPSIKTVSKEMGCSDMTISYAHINKSMGMGYLWSEEKTNKLDISLFKNIPQEKFVFKYDIYGKFLTSYNSCGEAAKALNTSRENVRDAIHDKRKCKGFYLSYDKIDKFEIIEKEKKSVNDKIYQYTLEGIFIKEFKNCKEAAEEINANVYSLQYKTSVGKSYKKYQ